MQLLPGDSEIKVDRPPPDPAAPFLRWHAEATGALACPSQTGSRAPHQTTRPPAVRRRATRDRSRSPASASLRQFLMVSHWMQFLPERLREEVVGTAYETHHEEREVVARRDDPVHSWIGVAQGLAKLVAMTSSGKVVRFTDISEGAWADEASLISRSLRPYDIVTIQRSRVVHVPAETFWLLLDSSYEFNRFVLGQVAARLSQSMNALEADRMSDPIAKLARALVGLFNPVLYPSASARLRVSQEDIGELAGMTRQRANHAIKSLERRGIVCANYGGLLINDLAALRRLAR